MLKAPIKYIITCLVVLVTTFSYVGATHIVGGGITYKCLGTTSSGYRYEIQVEIYQDCLNGIPEARAEDIPAFIGIFSNDNVYRKIDSIGNGDGGRIDSVIVPPNFKNDCVNNPPKLCLKRLTFTKTFELPFNSSGYKAVYVRCCRNESIININKPEQVGATYFCNIPSTPEVTCNTSARFNKYPPQIICINNPLVYDHSAFDADGDSISYELCDAYPGGKTDAPKPIPSNVIPKPITQAGGNPPSHGYALGFSPAKPMGGNPIISIDPETGMITGTPNLQGRFVVAVCAHEWRNGVRINTVSREFQFTVTNCSKAVVADMPQFSDEYNTYIVSCKSNTVNFINTSRGGFDYHWDFGTGTTSTDFQPTYTYPDTGTYEVELHVNKGSTCPDSITRLVKIYPTFDANFTHEGLPCPNSDIAFTDGSVATFKPTTNWFWDFGDGNISEEQNPVHRYAVGADYNVTLAAKTIKGCVDTITKTVFVEKFNPFAGNDTIIVKGEYIDFNATGGHLYQWTPYDNLNSNSSPRPRGSYPDTGVYSYNVHIETVTGCTGDDSINVLVVEQGSLFVPNAFTPNGDGRNDLLRPRSVGYRSYDFFRVFNRFGEMVYETKIIGDGWDGMFRGKRSDLGTYVWMLSAVDKDGIQVKKKGDAILIR